MALQLWHFDVLQDFLVKSLASVPRRALEQAFGLDDVRRPRDRAISRLDRLADRALP